MRVILAISVIALSLISIHLWALGQLARHEVTPLSNCIIADQGCGVDGMSVRPVEKDINEMVHEIIHVGKEM